MRASRNAVPCGSWSEKSTSRALRIQTRNSRRRACFSATTHDDEPPTARISSRLLAVKTAIAECGMARISQGSNMTSLGQPVSYGKWAGPPYPKFVDAVSQFGVFDKLGLLCLYRIRRDLLQD